VKLKASAGESSSDESFADYLEAKLALDERSLNVDVRQAALERLTRTSTVLRWLDVGTGTGSMIRRLLKTDLHRSLEITALDRDTRLLDIASTKISGELARLSYDVRPRGNAVEACKTDRQLRVDFRCCSLLEFEPKPACYDLITAHAFMDIVPIGPAVSRFKAYLAAGGVLYATLNYDGDTALLPLYADPAFEDAILDGYDASMEKRRVDAHATGGARSGRRLHQALRESDFDVLAYGSSDWNITPRSGVYRDRDADVLRPLLATIRKESERNPAIDADELARWYAMRTAQLERGELGIIVHQLDIAAIRR
jgi:SAM-dependent methyltransferase